MPQFIKVASSSEVLPNQGKVVDVGGQQIAIFNLNGDFSAINNVCPHRGGPLGEGNLAGSVVTCPWHGWQFDVKTGANPVNPAACVKTFPCKVEGNDLWVQI